MHGVLEERRLRLLLGLIEEVMHTAVQQGAPRCCCTLDNLANVLICTRFNSRVRLHLPILPHHLMSFKANGTETYDEQWDGGTRRT